MDGLKERTCIVTGATSGIGRVTAIELARMGATVVMICRNRTKGDLVLAEISRRYPHARAQLIVADLSLMADVSRAAHEFLEHHDQLHVLINNAGAIYGERQVTCEGLEATFAGNYLSTYLLTELLLDVLRASALARVVIVSSDGHFGASIDFDDLQSEKRYNFLRAYTQSKLAQVIYTYDLAQRLEGTGVAANVLHPGLVASNFNRGTKGITHLIAALIYRFRGISEEEGSKTTLHLATSPDVEGVNGRYFELCKERASSDASRDLSTRRRLMEASAILVSGRSQGGQPDASARSDPTQPAPAPRS